MKEIFIQRLRDLRNERKLYQKDLADHLLIARTTYASWEAGKSQPSIEQLILLADFFDVTVDYLIGRTDDFERRLD